MGIQVAVASASFNGGGAEQVAVQLASGFNHRGLLTEMWVNVPTGPYRAPALEGVGAERIREMGSGTHGLAKKQWVSQRRLHRDSALLSTGESVVIAYAGAGRGVRVARVASSLAGRHLQRKNEQGRLIARLFMSALSRYDHIVALSEAMADELSYLRPRLQARISVIGNPVLSPRLYQQATEPIDDITFHVPTLVYAGRLEPEKGIDELLDAYSLLNLGRHEAQLLVLGAGGLQAKTKQRVASDSRLRSVRLLGWVHNPYKYLGRADVFVLPSRFEGLSNSLVAAAALTPGLVAFNCPTGPADVITSVGRGELVESGDVSGFAEAIASELQRVVAGDDTRPWLEGSDHHGLGAHEEASVIAQYLDLFGKLEAQ